MKKCCDTCIHKKVCDYWEKEAHPDDYGTYDGEPCIDYFPADVTPVVHGEWIKDYESFCAEFETIGPSLIRYKCSICGKETYKKDNFCSDCGSKMDGGNSNGTV